MRNAKDTPIAASQIINTRIEARFTADGKYTACAFEGTWRGDEQNVKQVQTFKRGVHHVKLVIYNHYVENVEEWGAWLCASLIDRNERVWKHVDLSSCDR